MTKKHAAAAFAGLLIAMVNAVPARAELAFFASGRSLSIKSHRVEGSNLILELREGGQIICDPSVITRFTEDEVPYPEVRLKPDAASEEGTNALVRTAGLQPDAAAYAKLIDTMSAKHGVDARLVKALIQVESGYQERARSRKGAMGLMQLMPETARQYAVSDPYDPRANIEAGIKHLKSLLERFPLRLALAAYNAGEAAVQRFGGVPPYAETRDYVDRIVRLFNARSL